MLCRKKTIPNKSSNSLRALVMVAVAVVVLLNGSLALGQDYIQQQHSVLQPHVQEYAAGHMNQENFQYLQNEQAPLQYEIQSPTTYSNGPIQPSAETPHTKFYCGVDQSSGSTNGREPLWNNKTLIPFESYGPGEYIGPSRTPHVPAYRLRVDDQIEFVYQKTRPDNFRGYRLSAGDTIRITSSADENLNEASREDGLTIMPDNTISLDLIGNIVAGGKTVEELRTQLNSLYSRFYDTKPSVVVAGLRTGTKLDDFLASVDARAGSGGQSRQVTVSPDGTIRLPLTGTVGVVGLSLDELEREINMRYAQQLQGLRVTPILTSRAPRFVYVTGEVTQPGRFELTAPTSAMQAIALAGGWNNGGNLRQIVIFRRDKDWQLMAIKLDLAGGLFGRRPLPSDEIWLRDSDIVLVPKTPILRLADAIELYFSRSLYGVFPSELGSFDAQSIGGPR